MLRMAASMEHALARGSGAWQMARPRAEMAARRRPQEDGCSNEWSTSTRRESPRSSGRGADGCRCARNGGGTGTGSRECCFFGDKRVPFPPRRSSSDQQWTGLDSSSAPKRVYGSRSRVWLQSSVFLGEVTAEGSPPVHSVRRNLHGLITLESKGDREESAYSLPMALMF